MLIDTHAHSSGISRCCRAAAEEIIKKAKAAGLDGVVLTNHYQEDYLKNDDADAFAKAYTDEYLYAKKIAEKENLRIFFGIEVTAKKCDYAHILIYGIDESFVHKNPRIFDYTQEELYNAVHRAGGAVVQAHPFRHGGRLLDTEYLDGIEINCHQVHDGTYMEDIVSIAAKEGLIITCGGDYHADSIRPVCGTYLPDSIKSNREIAEFLRTTSEIKLCVQEVGSEEHCDMVYIRGKK